jgi:16S rRNA (cytosine1402-N4)-methyltransferase
LSSNNFYHQPVLLNEVIKLLQIKKGKIYLDATIGGGGHSLEIIKKGGFVFGLDWDQEAVSYSTKLLTEYCHQIGRDPQQCFQISQANFAQLNSVYTLPEKPVGILFDLGTSWHQLKTPNRGFSFQDEGPLDMRMDQNLGVKAQDLINLLTKGDLQHILSQYGEEQLAAEIALAIIRQRQKRPLSTTRELAQLVTQVYQQKNRHRGKIHPATKTFQALRMAVNFELDNLDKGLQSAFDLLPSKGRLVVISFQPLEDKLVTKFFQKQKKEDKAVSIVKPTKSSHVEQKSNPASRSAILRALEKYE